MDYYIKAKTFLKKNKINFKEETINKEIEYLYTLKIEGEKLKTINFAPFNENSNKIIYTNQLSPEKYLFLSGKEPTAIITNKIDEKNFYSEVPIFLSKKNFKDRNLKAEVKTKKFKYKIKFSHFNLGKGPYFINIIFPFNTKNYSDYIVFEKLINQLINLKQPVGIRLRIIFIKTKFLEDISEIQQKFYPKPIFNIIIKNIGLGKPKIVYKYNGFILFTDEILDIIISFKEKFGFPLKIASNSFFEKFKPSANNIFLTSEKNTDFTDDSLEFIAKFIYSFLNFIPKFIIK